MKVLFAALMGIALVGVIALPTLKAAKAPTVVAEWHDTSKDMDRWGP